MFSDRALLFWTFVTLAATFGVGAYGIERKKARLPWAIAALFLLLAVVVGFGFPALSSGYVATILRIVWMIYPLLTVTVVALLVRRRQESQPPSAVVDLSPIQERLAALEGREPPRTDEAVEAQIERIPALENRMEQLEQSAQKSGNESFNDVDKLERGISALAAAINTLIDPMIAAHQLRQLDGFEIPQPGASPALEYEIEGRPSTVPENWFVLVQSLPNALTQIVGDTSGDLDKRLATTAARIRGDALFTTPTEDEKAAGITPAAKQQFHLLKAQLEVIHSYWFQKRSEIERKVLQDGGARNAKHYLEEQGLTPINGR